MPKDSLDELGERLASSAVKIDDLDALGEQLSQPGPVRKRDTAEVAQGILREALRTNVAGGPAGVFLQRRGLRELKTIGAGLATIPGSIGGTMEIAGAEDIGHGLVNWSNRVQQAWMPKDPDIVDKVAHAFGTSLPFIPIGLATGGAASVMGLGGTAARILGATVAAGAEASIEAGSVATDVLSREAAKGTAKENAVSMARKAWGWSFLLNVGVISYLNRKGFFGKQAATMARDLVRTASMEGIQEGFQEIANSIAKKESVNWYNVGEAAIIGSILGGGTKGAEYAFGGPFGAEGVAAPPIPAVSRQAAPGEALPSGPPPQPSVESQEAPGPTPEPQPVIPEVLVNAPRAAETVLDPTHAPPTVQGQAEDIKTRIEDATGQPVTPETLVEAVNTGIVKPSEIQVIQEQLEAEDMVTKGPDRIQAEEKAAAEEEKREPDLTQLDERWLEDRNAEKDEPRWFLDAEKGNPTTAKAVVVENTAGNFEVALPDGSRLLNPESETETTEFDNRQAAMAAAETTLEPAPEAQPAPEQPPAPSAYDRLPIPREAGLPDRIIQSLEKPENIRAKRQAQILTTNLGAVKTPVSAAIRRLAQETLADIEAGTPGAWERFAGLMQEQAEMAEGTPRARPMSLKSKADIIEALKAIVDASEGAEPLVQAIKIDLLNEARGEAEEYINEYVAYAQAPIGQTPAEAEQALKLYERAVRLKRILDGEESPIADEDESIIEKVSEEPISIPAQGTIGDKGILLSLQRYAESGRASPDQVQDIERITAFWQKYPNAATGRIMPDGSIKPVMRLRRPAVEVPLTGAISGATVEGEGEEHGPTDTGVGVQGGRGPDIVGVPPVPEASVGEAGAPGAAPPGGQVEGAPPGPAREGQQDILPERGAPPGPGVAPGGGLDVGKRDNARDVGASNYRIADEDAIGVGGPVTRVANNIAAIKVLKAIEAEGRPATIEEKKILVKYVGWGGLKQIFDYSNPKFSDQRSTLQDLLTDKEYSAARASILNAHYTSRSIIQAMYAMLTRMGVSGHLRMLEPSIGIGHFIGLTPKSMADAVWLGVELDSISARISKLLYPKADIREAGFETVAINDDTVDVAIGNPPFGEMPIFEERYKTLRPNTHGFFFIKSIDKVRPGGLLAFITSRYTMDGSDAANTSARAYLAARADFVAAFRLPRETFEKSAGTSVTTDIIILKKRLLGAKPAGEGWDSLHVVKSPAGVEYRINDYYAKHPDHVLGDVTFSKGLYGAGEYGVTTADVPLEERLETAKMAVPVDIYVPAGATDIPVAIEAPTLRPYSHEIRNGKVYQRIGNAVIEVKGADVTRIEGLIGLLGDIRKLYASQLEGKPKEEVQGLLAVLNKSYDDFFLKYGRLNSKANENAFYDDPDYGILQSLEVKEGTGKDVTWRKSEVFTKPTIIPEANVTDVQDAPGALVVSLSETGKVDPQRIEKLLGRPWSDVVGELQGSVFNNPEGGWETAETYLSGNVVAKLKVAQEALAKDKTFQTNVDHLKQVQPEWVENPSILLGAPWVPKEVMSDFLDHITDRSNSFRVDHNQQTGSWILTARDKWALQTVNNTDTYGTEDMLGTDILAVLLQGNSPVVTATEKMPDGSKRTYVDEKATAAARQKAEVIKAEWQRWITEPEWHKGLVDLYNEVINVYRSPTFDGKLLRFPGASRSVADVLRYYQRNAIWRGLVWAKNLLLAHEVGLGKTFEMVGIAMETKRLGIARKSVIATPKANFEDFVRNFRMFYPNAKLLVTTKQDFTPKNRRAFLSRIAAGDWDAVVMTHEQLEAIPLRKDTLLSYLAEEKALLEKAIAAAQTEGGYYGRSGGRKKQSSRIIRDLEKAKKNLETDMANILSRNDYEDVIPFDELGIDQLIVDEAHNFKNLTFYTKRKRIAGLPNPKAGRAFDMFLKAKYISRKNNGRGVVFATGTPISNTIAEMYHMMRFLVEEDLRSEGTEAFDSWASAFAMAEHVLELNSTATGYKEKMRFSSFVNVPELMKRYKQFADIQTAEMVGIKRPMMKGGKPTPIVAKASQVLKDYVQSLVVRAGNLKGKMVKGGDNMLKINTDGRKASIDMRLIDPNLPDLPGSKVNLAVGNIFDIWDRTSETKGAQVVFLDIGTPSKPKKDQKPTLNLYADMRAKLIQKGVPREEIAFIHDFSGDAKEALFERVKSGQVRIIFGSTAKLGVGVNIQDKMIAAHHIDAPWVPWQVEQRDGRILRPGNENTEVEIYRYVTEGSYDAYIWQLLETKSRAFYPLKSGSETIRTIDDASLVILSAEEMKALSSGNPLVKEKVDIGRQILNLSLAKEAFENQLEKARTELVGLPERIAIGKQYISDMQADMAQAESFKDKKLEEQLVIEGKPATDRAEAATTMRKMLNDYLKSGQVGDFDIGTYRGFRLYFTQQSAKTDHPLILAGKQKHYSVLSLEGLAKAVASDVVSRNISEAQGLLERNEARLKDLQVRMKAKFEDRSKLDELLKRQKEIDKTLGIKVKDEITNEGDMEGTEGTEDESKAEEETRAGEEEADEDDETAPMLHGGRAVMAKPARREDIKGEFAIPGGETGQLEGARFERIKGVELWHFVQEVAKAADIQIRLVVKRLPKSWGLMKWEAIANRATITVDPSAAADPVSGQQVLSHEVGHFLDVVADIAQGRQQTLSRGNVVGRIFSLYKWMRETFGTAKVKNKEVRAELIALSKWWHPYDELTAEASYIKYRQSAKELYADMWSVLLNSPLDVQTKAPKFWKAFWQGIDAKPDVKQTLLFIQQLYQTKGEAKFREALVLEGYARGEGAFKAAFAKKKIAERSFFDKFQQDMLTWFAPSNAKLAEWRGKGLVVPNWIDPWYDLREIFLSDNPIHTMMKSIQAEVTEPLAAIQLDEATMGYVLQMRRIAFGDRRDLYNPNNLTPETAREQLKAKEKELGAFRWKALIDIVTRWQGELYADEIEARQVELIDDEGWRIIEANKDFYAKFTPTGYVKDFVPPHLITQQGTFSPIANPFMMTLMYRIAVKRAIANQRIRMKWVETADLAMKAGIESSAFQQEVKGWWKEGHPPQKQNASWLTPEGHGLIWAYDKGKKRWYKTDPYIAEAFQKWHTDDLMYATNILGMTLRTGRTIQGGFWHKAWVTFNIGWHIMNQPRDWVKTWKAGISIVEILKNAPGAVKEAVGFARGEYSKDVQEMLDDMAMPAQTFAQVYSTEQADPFDLIMARYGQGQQHPSSQNPALKFLQYFSDGMTFISSVGEAWTKITGWKALRVRGESTRQEIALQVRENIGTPAWMYRGRYTRSANVVFPYARVMMAGWQSTHSLISNPKTRMGYMFKTAALDVMPAMMTAMAGAGLLGAMLKAFFDRIPDYDKRNYLVIPIGWKGDGPDWKTVYIRLPHEETGRFIAGVVFTTLSGMTTKGLMDIFSSIADFGGGQLPGVTPTYTIPAAWLNMMRGKNPYDSFRGRYMIPDEIWKAGWLPRFKRMTAWTIDQTGWTKMATHDLGEQKWYEVMFRITPGLNRLIKISNAGLREQQGKIIAEKESVRSRQILAREPEAVRIKRELSTLRRTQAAGGPINRAQARALSRRARRIDRRERLERERGMVP